MFSFTVDAFEKVWAWFIFLFLESRWVSFEIRFTLLHYFLVTFGFMKTIVLDTFGTMHMAYKSYMTSSPIILTLWSFWIYVCTLNCCNVVTNVKTSVSRSLTVDFIFIFSFHFILLYFFFFFIFYF